MCRRTAGVSSPAFISPVPSPHSVVQVRASLAPLSRVPTILAPQGALAFVQPIARPQVYLVALIVAFGLHNINLVGCEKHRLNQNYIDLYNHSKLNVPSVLCCNILFRLFLVYVVH